MFWAGMGATQANSLKTKWHGPGVFQGALELCHLVTTAGAIVSTGQRRPCVHHIGTALVERMVLMSEGPGTD